ncbi:hypothetical protein BC828DRAFT_409379 [Blastocladiella britannica]|nr:hypothetical protein BC828DRAFT_409379 [Blastocladiella britannica]
MAANALRPTDSELMHLDDGEHQQQQQQQQQSPPIQSQRHHTQRDTLDRQSRSALPSIILRSWLRRKLSSVPALHAAHERWMRLGHSHPTVRSLLVALAPLVILCIAFPLCVRADNASFPAPYKIALLWTLALLLGAACLYGSPNRRGHPHLMLGLTPLAAYLVLFSLAKQLPYGWLPPVNTTWLPAADRALLGGKTATDIFAASTSDTRDIVAWLWYGVAHFLSAPTVGISLLVWGWLRTPPLSPSLVLPMAGSLEMRTWDHLGDGEEELGVTGATTSRRRRIWRQLVGVWVRGNAAADLLKAFLALFGCTNLTGVMVQYTFPSAAPWYNIKYGSVVPDISNTEGDPGGLIRVDRLLGITLYESVFNHSPLVYGAFPSLHSAYATLICVFVSDHFRWLPGSVPVGSWRLRIPTAAVLVPYVLMMWWATAYLTHHYLIDVLGGGVLALSFYAMARPVCWRIHRRFLETESGGPSSTGKVDDGGVS